MRRTRDDRFDIVDEFVADKAYRTPGEPWQSGQRDGTIFLHHALDHFETVFHAILARRFAVRRDAKLLRDLAVFDDFKLATGLPNHRTRIATNERVASEMFAAFHRFKKKRFALA